MRESWLRLAKWARGVLLPPELPSGTRGSLSCGQAGRPCVCQLAQRASSCKPGRVAASESGQTTASTKIGRGVLQLALGSELGDASAPIEPFTQGAVVVFFRNFDHLKAGFRTLYPDTVIGQETTYQPPIDDDRSRFVGSRYDELIDSIG